MLFKVFGLWHSLVLPIKYVQALRHNHKILVISDTFLLQSPSLQQLEAAPRGFQFSLCGYVEPYVESTLKMQKTQMGFSEVLKINWKEKWSRGRKEYSGLEMGNVKA